MTGIDLANPGQLLLGARANGYPGVLNGTIHGLQDHERRIGRRVHLGMTFVRPGQVPLRTASDMKVARRPGTGLVVCWKPAAVWAQAAGRHWPTTAYIGQVARWLAATRTPVLLVLHHEPENDVGRAGSTAHYQAMWRHVRSVFDDHGAVNVAWGAAFMNYDKWDSLLPQLWPDPAPDWCWWNAYGSAQRPDWAENVGRFYTGLQERRWFDPGAAHWGVREWSTKGLGEAEGAAYFQGARQAVQAGMFPLVRAYVVFDSDGSERDPGMQIGRNSDGSPAPAKQAAYREFAHEAAFGPVQAP
jgi:hypothetical protein